MLIVCETFLTNKLKSSARRFGFCLILMTLHLLNFARNYLTKVRGFMEWFKTSFLDVNVKTRKRCC